MKTKSRHAKAIRRKARQGFRGYPVGTVAFYGPDDRSASKVAVGIILVEDGEPERLERWFSDSGDVRDDHRIQEEVFAFLKENQVKTVALADRILGCPHEEGIDYPDGEECQACPFWIGRDRFSGDLIH